MSKKAVVQLDWKEECRVCPSCRYQDGFHTVLRRKADHVQVLLRCPSCQALFDVGWQMPLAAFAANR